MENKKVERDECRGKTRETMRWNIILLCFVVGAVDRANGFQNQPYRSTLPKKDTRLYVAEKNPVMDFLSSLQQQMPTNVNSRTGTIQEEEQRRRLGSQENLMLPRQYSPNPDVTFPQMNHVSCVIVSSTPSEKTLRLAIDELMIAHPLLRCTVQGNGEPTKRIDLFQMVRQGEPNPCTFVSQRPGTFTSKDVLSIVDVMGSDKQDLYDSWKSSFNKDLDDGSWCTVESTPLWKIELHRMTEKKNGPCAILFSFNHAISDQGSASKLTDQLISLMAEIDSRGRVWNPPRKQNIPLSVEESVLGKERTFQDVQIEDFTPKTIQYVAGKALEETKSPVILPDAFKRGGGILGAITTITGNAAGGDDQGSIGRKSVLEFRSLSSETTTALLQKCRENGVSVSNALSAAMTLTATDFVSDGTKSSGVERNYKVLQSLDMRRFGEMLDKGESVGCLAGSMDLMHGPFPDKSGEMLRRNPTSKRLQEFWNLAVEGKTQTLNFIENDGPQNAVRIFDFAMTISDMNNLVHLTAQSKDSQGRAYSAGFTNAGVYERMDAFTRENDKKPTTIKTEHGKYKVEDLFFAASNARSGTLYRFSCMTVDGEIKFTFHPAAPIVDEEMNARFADALIEMLEIVAGVKDIPVSENPLDIVPKGFLTKLAASVGAVSLLTHAGAYASFFHSVLDMKAKVAPEEFWSAMNFWIFFAVGHVILEPVLWISDVLHGSPGPMVGGLVPATFILGNLLAIGAVSYSKEIRNAVNVAALFGFLSYVGAGLDGTAGLGDYNLQLDDSYQGQVVKGCPAYEEVRQPSMDDFQLKKFEGLWYEHKFHDYTQFKEVYDTTLNIKLTEDGKGWIDDFGVKGPAPDAAKLSWDKSPVANGAHYFLFGRVDPNDPPGILRESGFGVEFPDYIVDVKKDPTTGEYQEAIQFQCLERGGVRVFEGINFMSRNPVMTNQEMTAMHARAKQAGMYPYGASPEQMHTVARRPIGAPPIDNNWQAMWRALGVDKLLELLTKSIEDGGR